MLRSRSVVAHTDWMPLSASALVAGGTAFAVAVLMTPTLESSAPVVAVVGREDERWLAVAGLYFFAGAALIGGLPAVLSLLDRRRTLFGMIAATVFSIGALGTTGYAALLVFLHALWNQNALQGGENAVQPATLEELVGDPGVTIFLVAWVGAFYLGQALLAIALLRARAVRPWVAATLLGYLLVAPVEPLLPEALGRLDVLLVAIGFAAVGIEANNRSLAG